MRVVTFKIEEELLKKLDLYAINMRLTRSEVIREAINILLSKVTIQEENNNITRTQEI
ncbi:hypothetical protein [Sulfolobus monocaudavirus SMV4]|uniref:CopG-like transcriptional repressor n=1 Tax=Sulfolobus monocaudavirus SMV4 TaxID=1732178 RepID=UPI0007057685|nr:CopG-like transcriptional repressor [Sulfolobus monocaudavirus SMV4]ALG97082.1 hypothetical protein [Sulfolobus monocaudavirus SMV4]